MTGEIDWEEWLRVVIEKNTGKSDYEEYLRKLLERMMEICLVRMTGRDKWLRRMPGKNDWNYR